MKDTILNNIIKNKIKWIQNRKKIQPLKDFQYKINKNTRQFYHSLKKKHPFFILECKKKSPSLGVIRKNFDLLYIASVYKKYASAISVLTDEKYFDGNFSFINTIRKHVDQPILCKDFFVDPYQIYLSRYYYADAILLMLSILNNEQYKKMSKIAMQLNMGIITEINNKKELERAIELKAKIIGINNRNLHDLSIDLNRTRFLAPLIKKNVIIISESGIKKYHEVKDLSRFVHGFLIGSNLMHKENLDVSVRSMLIGKNKVCGLTRKIDACIAEKYGSVYGGLIFVKRSPRNVTEEIAKHIIHEINLRYIGVFQDEDINIVVKMAKKLSLFGVQLHGSENQKYIDLLRIMLPKNIQIWKALSISSKVPNVQFNNVNQYIFDSVHGGSNTCFDWSILKNCVLNKIILAGGINENNCIKASEFNCEGLDLNSGVEISPGIKDHKKIKLVFQKLRYY
ncbi:bifunctional indole-3-glycerol-phosphate synthase TrpC/phosphoribosylanthranilate isomerase TrpF [Buchnera aphidicola (Muscaphis stroyani)]|uniref:Multifunctional fusion protein n=1 Tax=Buchnera aphidicola (Muscaphis stroyani) TaxID=1241869 RepID=A0A4D6YEV2_9GAMM|nr:bifunctional indole-3-glycerol-phosphate synthase TrpC/phosphoribosylanthranilate isomerase TrpF [Buchnera aphidicola]QCI24354.1 bifunctional indole-3-glycerol-phosphate synthase TrpC/phosphoribosylanthranilate isomerase TrpF [Buchnera aphidicola (Muscaphis stroyani)]